jgi:hypothetical protein
MTDCANGRDEQVCGDCTFEQSICQWLDVSIGAFAWKNDQAMNVAQYDSGPVVDRKFRSSVFSK